MKKLTLLLLLLTCSLHTYTLSYRAEHHQEVSGMVILTALFIMFTVLGLFWLALLEDKSQ